MLEEIDVNEFVILVGQHPAIHILEDVDAQLKQYGNHNASLLFYTIKSRENKIIYITIDGHIDKETDLSMIDNMYISDEQMPDELLDIVNKRKEESLKINPDNPVKIEVNMEKRTVYKKTNS